MVAYYVSKIKDPEAINPKTGKRWCLEDVPKLWRKKVEAALSE